MAKLVHECLDFAHGQQRRLVLGRLRKIHRQGYQWADIVAIFIDTLLTEARHPCSALFCFTGEEIDVKHTHGFAVLVGHVIDFDLGMEHLCVMVGDKSQPIHACGETEHALCHTTQLKIGSEHLIVNLKK